MAYVVQCEACETQMTLSDALFERRIAGRQVTLRCKRCHQPLVVEGVMLREGAPSAGRTSEEVDAGPAVAPVTEAAVAPQALRRPSDYRPLTGFPSVPPPPALIPRPSAVPRPRPTPTEPLSKTDVGTGGPPRQPGSDSRAARATAPPPLPRRVKTTIGLPRVGAGKPVSPATPTKASAGAALPVTLPPAPAPRNHLLDCPAPPTPPPPPPSAPVESPPSPTRADEASPQPSPPLDSWTTSGSDGAAADEMSLAEHTTTGYALGASDPPLTPTRPRRFPLIGAAVAAVLGAGFAAAMLLTKAADDATLVTAATARDEAPDRAVSRTAAASAMPRAERPVPAPSSSSGLEPRSPPPAETEPTRAATELTPNSPSTALPGSESIPQGVHAPTVLHRIHLAMKRAEDCHKGGRAVGTALVSFTFAPNGSVSAVRLDGEPIASAPVGGCIRQEASLVRIPRFQGEPFTVTRKLRLR